MNAPAAFYVPARLPPIAQPPHDPTSLLLNARAGWRAQEMQQVEIQPIDACGDGGGLALMPWPGSERRSTEESGSFGGLRLPGNVALAPDGDLYLLDRSQGALKFFDRCDCAFKRMPCFGEAGPDRHTGKSHASAERRESGGPWRLHQANGIAIGHGNLYICDTGNARVLQLSLHGLMVRRALTPPAGLKLPQEWEPVAIVVDGCGTLHISDRANGMIHRVQANGQWLEPIGGLGGITYLALDCHEVLYALLVQDKRRVVRIEPAPVTVSDQKDHAAWVLREVDARADVLAHRFPCSPLAVDATGTLYLAPWCERLPGNNSAGAFDLNGNPVSPNHAVSGPLYMQSGTYVSLPLDSERYRCQWHRVIVQGRLPPGTRLRIDSFSAEVELDAGELVQVVEQNWSTRVTLTARPAETEWDALIRSEPGRFLWLRLSFSGSGMDTPVIERMIVEFPRISLRRHLPAVYSAEPVSADFTDRFLALFDTSLRSIERELDRQARLFDPLSAPDEDGKDFLSWIASWIGVSADRRWPEARRRQFIKQASQLFAWRGTRYGLWRLLLLLLDMQPEQAACPRREVKRRCLPAIANCWPEQPLPPWMPPPLILEHTQLRRWLFVGSGRLGDDAVLWGRRIVNRSQLDTNARVGETRLVMTPDPWRDPFHVDAHRFTVFIPSRVKSHETTRKALEALLQREAPAHTAHRIEYVEPRFRVGVQAMIGLDAVVARMPSGVRLAESRLRHGTVLSGAGSAKDLPDMTVGKSARVGSRLGSE